VLHHAECTFTDALLASIWVGGLVFVLGQIGWVLRQHAVNNSVFCMDSCFVGDHRTLGISSHLAESLPPCMLITKHIAQSYLTLLDKLMPLYLINANMMASSLVWLNNLLQHWLQGASNRAAMICQGKRFLWSNLHQ